jgi:hypothetical protein
MNGTISTKYGTAQISGYGYYRIVSGKNAGKLLHRLIFEEFYNVTLPSDIIVHHIDGNKTNNEIWNLEPMTWAEHNTIHHIGMTHSDEFKQRMHDRMENENNSMYGEHHSLESNVQMSMKRNNTGIFRVKKRFHSDYKQGFAWVYRYYDNYKAKELSSVSIVTLKEKVLAKGLDWIVLDEEKAMECGAL